MENLVLDDKILDIARDFEIFIKYVDENQLKLSKKTETIGKINCFEINNLFILKEDYEKATFPLKSYTELELFFKLSIESGLYEIRYDIKDNAYLMRTEKMNNVDELNLEEKYLLLLELYFRYSGDTSYDNTVISVHNLLLLISKIDIKEVEESSKVIYDKIEVKILNQLRLFKLCSYRILTDTKRDAIKAIEADKFAVKMSEIIIEKRKIIDWNQRFLSNYINGEESLIGLNGLYDSFIYIALNPEKREEVMDYLYNSKEPFYYAFNSIFKNVFHFDFEFFGEEDEFDDDES